MGKYIVNKILDAAYALIPIMMILIIALCLYGMFFIGEMYLFII